MMIGRDEIATLIPHAGAMCLLDGVLNWDDTSIRCVSARHRAADNPLRSHGRLGAACALEFAAQAMAVHGGLLGGAGPRPKGGYLASVRELACRVERLDSLAGDLVIEAERLAGDGKMSLYRFAVHCAGLEALSGRAAVVFDPSRA